MTTAKTILITGSTDGIGLEAAKLLVDGGHTVLVHGRNPEKLKTVRAKLSQLADGQPIAGYVADLADMAQVRALASSVAADHKHIDVLINNAGVFKVPSPVTTDGLDVRFVVNTIAPYLLTTELASVMDGTGRVINLSSAAQEPISDAALAGQTRLSDFSAYAQSKLAITMWSHALGVDRSDGQPAIIAINPGSMLATKMVKAAFGSARAGADVGAKVLTDAALSDAFASASGRYFDNDQGRFAMPHADILDREQGSRLIATMQSLLAEMNGGVASGVHHNRYASPASLSSE